MADFFATLEPVQGLETGAWRKILTQIPTVLGRLEYLAQLRNPATGKYTHPALNELVGVSAANRTLCHSHSQIFFQWISFSLAEQKADLDQYLGSLANPAEAFPNASLIPPTAHEVERLLYLTDLEALVELRRSERGGVFAIPEA